MSAKVQRLLGLARRAGQLVSGDTAVRQTVNRGRAHLLVLAGDAAPRTARAFQELASAAALPVIIFGSRAELGCLLGCPLRAVAVVTDRHLARGILAVIDGEENEN
ncbi:L7Ae/L30e/S12e/Gadd45 family ribosomal protein [Desulfotomaculum copahuensis]|uniref:Ribosomal protein eL8/eL30/eS12/Gadd45 domain-containing protein n=1 Tax=Desulfotomaculum copahuensis TaxID=1838280 RepID=A0A1B7LHV7_9FIRM|nr:L7Ae/L30e/S12e/Gadd45 family ribosomal protein [Desulfotomaculum copahuensis]OAT85867.1 hypothetical protein A6M21_05170 [Desulfotomaculum copahuensis]